MKNEVKNQNLSEKLSRIGHFEIFDFWSKVNAISRSQQSTWSTVYMVWVESRIGLQSR